LTRKQLTRQFVISSSSIDFLKRGCSNDLSFHMNPLQSIPCMILAEQSTKSWQAENRSPRHFPTLQSHF